MLNYGNVVALYTSAWIEIRLLHHVLLNYHVALYTSAWIEIVYTTQNNYFRHLSHSTRVRGLK